MTEQSSHVSRGVIVINAQHFTIWIYSVTNTANASLAFQKNIVRFKRDAITSTQSSRQLACSTAIGIFTSPTFTIRKQTFFIPNLILSLVLCFTYCVCKWHLTIPRSSWTTSRGDQTEQTLLLLRERMAARFALAEHRLRFRPAETGGRMRHHRPPQHDFGHQLTCDARIHRQSP